MKTLFINIYRDITSSYPNAEIFNSGKDNILDGFYISLGMAIAEGVVVNEYKPLVASFATEKPIEFESSQSQWEELKLVLLGKDPEGEFDFQLSSEYLEWLKMNYSSVYYQKYQGQHQAFVKLDIEELYEDTIDAIRRKVLRFLQENDNYKNFDEFVINDNLVTRRSKLVRAIKDKYEDNLAFVSYEKWKEGTKEEVCPKCRKNPCECKPEEPVCPKCGKNPCECNNGVSEMLILALNKSVNDFGPKGLSIYDCNQKEIYSQTVNCGHLEIRMHQPKNQELEIYVGEGFGFGDYHRIGFDGSVERIGKENAPWNKQSTYNAFDKDAFLRKHPEYDGCERPYHEVYSDNFIIECYKKGSDCADIFTNDGTLLCSLPSKTYIERVFPSGLYAVQQYVDDDYLAFGIADKYGKILVPCQYRKHHRMQAEHCPFDEKSPGIVLSTEFDWKEGNLKNVFTGDTYDQITKDIIVKWINKEDGSYDLVIIDKDTYSEKYRIINRNARESVRDLKEGWYEIGGIILRKERYFQLQSEQEQTFDRVFSNHSENDYFVSQKRIITAEEEEHGFDIKVTRIYDYDGNLMTEINNTPNNHLWVKTSYKYGKALGIRLCDRKTTLCYLDLEGNEHQIPYNKKLPNDEVSILEIELFMVSETSFVINRKDAGYTGELRGIDGKILYKKASWILPFADKYLAYYSSKGGYGVIDSKGNRVIAPKFDEFEMIEHVGDKYIRYRQYGDSKEL